MHESSACPLDTIHWPIGCALPKLHPTSIPAVCAAWPGISQQTPEPLTQTVTMTNCRPSLSLGFHNTAHAIGRNSKTAYKMWMWETMSLECFGKKQIL